MMIKNFLETPHGNYEFISSTLFAAVGTFHLCINTTLNQWNSWARRAIEDLKAVRAVAPGGCWTWLSQVPFEGATALIAAGSNDRLYLPDTPCGDEDAVIWQLALAMPQVPFRVLEHLTEAVCWVETPSPRRAISAADFWGVASRGKKLWVGGGELQRRGTPLVLDNEEKGFHVELSDPKNDGTGSVHIRWNAFTWEVPHPQAVPFQILGDNTPFFYRIDCPPDNLDGGDNVS